MTGYTDMTDEGYDALDEELTRTTPRLGLNGTGFLSQREMRSLGLTNLTVNYLSNPRRQQTTKVLPRSWRNWFLKTWLRLHKPKCPARVTADVTG